MTTERTPCILIIDNDEGVVRAIETRLESQGYCCQVAMSGAQGVASFREQPADLVITDLNMPAGDGIDLVRSLRTTSDVPVIIVTGFRDDYEEQLQTIPNVTMLQKPFDSNTLIELVETELAMYGRFAA